MGLSGVVGPNGSYTPPASGSLTAVNSDIGILQSNYNNALVAVNNATPDYTSNYQLLQQAIDQYQSDLESSSPNTANSRADLVQKLSDFTTTSSDYQPKLQALALAARELTNAHHSYQALQDSQINTALNGFVTSLSGKIDPATYQDLQQANSTRQNARSSLVTALTNFETNEDALAGDRATLSTQLSTVIKDHAQALIDEGLEPTNPAANSEWKQYETDKSAMQVTQGSVTTHLSQRTGYRSALDGAISAYNDSYENATTGFVTILQQAATDANTDVTGYIGQIAIAKDATDSYMSNYLQQQQDADSISQQQHYAAFPSQDPNLSQITADANASATNSINQLVNGGVSTVGTDLELPTLPGVGEHMSMLDFMRFLTASQLIASQIDLQSQQADSGLNDLRLQIWSAILSANNTELAEASSYLSGIASADRDYNKQVDQENTGTQGTIQQEVTGYNAEITRINHGIDLINAKNQTLTDNETAVTADLNTSAQDAVTTINETNNVEPNAINTLNILRDDPDAPITTTTPLPNPTPITVTPYPQFSHVPQLPSPIPAPDASQASIDSFNATLKQINDTVFPISDELDSINPPPVNFQELTPLFYRQDIPVRSMTDVFNFGSVVSSLSSLFDLVDRGSSSNILQQTIQNPLFVLALSKLAPTKGQSTQGAGGGTALASANANIDVTTTGQLLDQLIRSEQYGSFVKKSVEDATLVAGIQTGVRPPSKEKNYSTFGVLRGEFTTEGTKAKDAEVEKTNKGAIEDDQLKAVATQLIHKSDNVKELEQNANLVIAQSGLTKKLSDADLKKLKGALVLLQKVTLLLLAGIALGSVGAKNDSKVAAENLVSLILGSPAKEKRKEKATAPVATTTPPPTPPPPPTASATAPPTPTPTPAPKAAVSKVVKLPQEVTATAPPKAKGAVTQAAPKAPLPAPPAQVVAAFEKAGASKEVAKELVSLVQAALTPEGIEAALPGGKGAFTKIIFDLQKAGLSIPQELRSPDNPDLLKTIFNELEKIVPAENKPQLHEEVANLLTALGVPKEAVNEFNGLLKSGATLGEAVTKTIVESRAPKPLPSVLESLGLSKTTAEQLSQLIQASFSPVGVIAALPNGKTQFDQIIKELQKAGFALPAALSPENPDFIFALLDKVDEVIEKQARSDLIKHVFEFLATLNLPKESLVAFKTSISKGETIGKAVQTAFNGAVAFVIRNLNINLNAIPEPVRTKLEAQVSKILAPIPNLTSSDKLSLALALGLGKISSESGKAIAKALAAIATFGATPKTVTAAVTSFERARGHTEHAAHVTTPTTTTTVPGGDPKETRHLSTMPKDIVTLFQEHFNRLTIDDNDKKYLQKVTEDFAKSVVTQHDFYQFSINFLLDPAKSILKNFSIFTAEQVKGGRPPTDQMRIAS